MSNPTAVDCAVHRRRSLLANFNDPRSLEAALEGVTRAYLVTPSSPDAEVQQVRFAELAVAAGDRHLVKLSQFGADEASPVRSFATMRWSNDEFESSASASRFSGPTCTFQGLLAFQSMRRRSV